MTDTEALKCVALLAAAYPTPAWSDETIEIYTKLMVDLDAEATQAAVVRWVESHDDRPSIAAIRESVRAELARAGAVPTSMEPDEAWGLLMRAFARVGSHRPFPAHRWPLLGEVVARMGWENLCRSENIEADRAHFLKLYRAALQRQRHDDVVSPGMDISRATPGRTALDRQTVTELADHAHEASPPPRPVIERPVPAEYISPIRAELRALASVKRVPETPTAEDERRRAALREQASRMES
jgi:hypothetical protein